MENPFEDAMNFVFQWEGGYSNTPGDPGGHTNYGITLRTLQDAGIDIDGDGDIDVDDIKKLDPETAVQLYKAKYWNPIGGNELDWPMAIVAFDTAVNCGVARTKRWLQTTQDKGEDYTYLVNLRVIHYLNIISRNPVLAKFKRGWLNRVNDLKKYIDVLSVREENPNA